MHPHLAVVFALFLLLPAAAQRAHAAAEPTDLDAAVRANRMGTLIVRAEPGATVKVTQQRHEFWFGTAISRGMFRPDVDPDARRQYLAVLKDNFNSAVHENALKWYSTERVRGQVSYEEADRMLDWCEENGLVMRGHCLFWCVDRYVQGWIKDLDDAALREAVRRRALDVTTRYHGRIVEYDVNNEMLHASFYRGRLGEDIRADMFRLAREGDPDALLYVNDYNILSGRDAARYEQQIEDLLAQGAPVGGIGCQGHFGGSIDMGKVRETLDRLGRFGLPVKVTEFDINIADEQRKARLLEEFYRTCFAHPAVEGILMWGFWEGAHWRPKAALWKRDFTPTPAAEAYRRLVFDEWWTRWEGQADAEGRCEVPAFFGRHRVEVAGRGKDVDLPKADRTVEITCTAPDPAAWAVRPG